MVIIVMNIIIVIIRFMFHIRKFNDYFSSPGRNTKQATTQNTYTKLTININNQTNIKTSRRAAPSSSRRPPRPPSCAARSCRCRM